jgi:hypothetical protein
MEAGMIGVHTGPGATVFARSPYWTTSWASPLVKVMMAPLVLDYARVTARYDGFLAFELAASAVGIDTVVWLRLHLLLQAGVLLSLVLFGILWLRILLRRVLLPVLVFWHPDLPSTLPSLSFLALICPFSCRIKL